jgi:hypothetical protein
MKIKHLTINGMRVEKDIIRFTYPGPSRPLWRFYTKEGTIICATGHISFEMFPEEGESNETNCM